MAGWGSGPSHAPGPPEFKPRRFGADPPEALISLRTDASRDLLATFGILPSTFAPNPSGQVLREAWRVYVSLTLVPLLRSLEAQLKVSLDEPDLAITAGDARAADLSTLARGYRSLRDGGMNDADAREVMGL